MMKKQLKYRAVLLLTALLAACTGEPDLRNGDLIFQANEDGGFVNAIEHVTDGIWSHVGIIQQRADGIYVLEAVPAQGVVRTSLDDFLEASARDSDGRPLVRVCRIRGLSSAEADNAVERAESWLGRPYDEAFAPGTEALYCSELVYESFLREDGNPFFQARPMTFKGPDGETDPYWIRYYERLACEIPEGVPGTNPNDLSREMVLVPVPWPL